MLVGHVCLLAYHHVEVAADDDVEIGTCNSKSGSSLRNVTSCLPDILCIVTTGYITVPGKMP